MLFVVDDSKNQGETNEANNTYAVPIRIGASDLLVKSVATQVPNAQFGQTLDVTWTVRNAGVNATIVNWSDRIWLSTDGTFNNAMPLLTVPFGNDTPLASNSEYTKTATVTLPLNPSLNNGNYYILIQTDAFEALPEFNENNNSKISQPIALTLPPIPDLKVKSIVAPVEGLSGQQLEISWILENLGTGDATGNWYDNIFLSNDSIVGGDQYFGSFSFEGTIAVGQSITRKQLIELPNDLSGNRWVIVQTDANNQVYEHANESNNIAISQQPINISLSPFPNLKVSSVTAPSTAFSGQQTVIEWTVTNTGTGSTSAPIWYDAVWLSLDDQFDSSDIYLGKVENASYLNVNESYTNRLTVTLPENVDGNYHFLVKTDYNAQVYELQNEGDNFGASDTSRIELTPPPDLQPTAVIAPSQTFSGQTMTLNWTVTNNGPGRTSQYSWYDQIYMSADDVLDGGDRYLGQLYHGGDLDVGESYNASRNVTLPIGVSGDFYFFVKTDAGNSVHELAYEANNAVHQPTPTTVRLTPPPDLEVELVDSPALALASHPLTINYRVVNYGATATPNYAWTDAIYLSADTQFDKNADILLGDVRHYGFLDAGGFYNGSATFTLPNGLNGTFYTFVVTDKGNEVFELNKTNNVGFDTSTLAVSSRPADLVISAVEVTTGVEAGKTARISWTVTNQGIGDTAVNSWTDKIIASIDTVLGNNDDIFLASFRHSDTLSLIDGSYMSGLLNPGDSYSRSELVSIPFSMIGNYHLFVTADAGGQVYEATALDNNSTSSLVTVNRQTPDLQITDVNAPTAAISGNKLTVNWTAQNFGIGRTNAYSWYDSVYLSSDSILNEQQDIYLGQVFHSGALNPLAQYNGTGTFNLPIDLTGNYYVIVSADKSSDRDYDNRVLEDPLENNNYQATTTTTTISLGSVPNLVVQSVDAPLVGISGQLFNLTWTVRNDGSDTGYKPWYDAIYLSRDQIFDRSSDIYLDYRYHAGGLTAGQSYTENQLFKIPQGLSGPLYVFVVTDGGNQIYERSGEGNNVGYDGNSMQVNLPLPTDLTVGSITIPANAVPGQNATISYTVNNLGPNAAQGIWYDSIYISADDKWDINDAFFARIQPASYVPASFSYSAALTAPLPGVIPGDYHVIVRSDIRNAIVESNENNNIGASLNQVTIDAEALQLGGFDNGTLFQGQSVYYKINVAAGETLQVKFDSASDEGFNELYIRYGEMPSVAKFDYGFENVTADQQVIVPFTEAGTYYVLARAVKAPDWVSNVVIDENTTVSGLANNYTIKAKTIDFGITSIGQTVGDRAGKVTIEIFGAKFNQLMTAELIDASGHSIVASDIWFEDSTDVFATFDLSNAAIGTYDLKVSEPSLSQTANGDITPIISNILEDGFRVVDARADDVLVTVTSTPAVSPGQSFDIIVSYANRGTHDVTAPVIVVNADSDIRLQNIQDSDEFAQFGSIALLGISNEGQAGILRPGETGIVRLRGTAPSVAGLINITARQMLDDGTPVNYGDFIEYLGGDISDKSWAAATTALQNEFGNSWSSFQAGLGKRATELAKIGDYTHSATELWTDVALDAWGKAYFNNFPTLSTESSLLTPYSSIQAENATVIDNGLSEINNNTQLLFNTVVTESSALELNNNVQSFGFEPSSQFSNENLPTNQALTVRFPQEEIFETVEAIAKLFGYAEDAVVGIKVPGGVEPIGRTGPAAETSFDFTITLDDIGNPTLADVLDDLAGVNPAVDISSYALDIASSVDFDKNNIAALLALLEPYYVAFDTLIRYVEQKILQTAEQFENGSFLQRPPAPTAGAALRHFVGQIGSTPESLADSYEESVKQAISTTNPKAPLWFTNKVIEIGKLYGTEWKTYDVTYPFAPNPTGHVHIDDDYALGTAIPNIDLVQIPNEIVKDISESQEYKSAIDALKKKLNLAVERGFFYTVIEAGFNGPGITKIQLPDGEKGHTFNFEPDKAPIIPLQRLLYNPTNEISDFYEDTDVFFAIGQINYQYAVVNSITITESSNKRNYTADISVLGVDSYSWQNDDRANQSKNLYNLTGIDPAVFEYVWLVQQYGYGQPFTLSYEIDEITSGSVPIPDDSPPKKPPTPPSNDSPFNPFNPFNPFDPGHSTTNIIVSKDPNDILGPQGFGAERWISATDPLNYTIRFENDPELATAPAQVVRITQQLDSDLDFRTFRLDDFGFGDTFIDVPDNRAFYQTRLDLTATKGIYVDVIAGVDIATGQAFWEFTSIDPATGVEPTNPLLGFLPPDLTSPEGEGFVSYSVRPKSSIENGAVIDAQARIIFDINEPIDTPAISNTIDTGKPTSTVNALPSNINDTSFQVTWSGSDNAGGSALADFTIYVSDNGKSFVPWLQNTTLSEATFTGQAGHTYAFYSVARDNAGNVQEVPTQSQASTQVANGNNNPALAVNQGLTLNEEGTADITPTQLQITDADNTGAQIIYTLTNLPIHGSLKVNGTALTVSNTFTQADINNNRLTYTHDGSETTSDSFNFTVADGAGGIIDSTIFNITVNPVNDAPTLEKQIADQTATEDSAFSFTIKSDTFKDVDAGDYLTYSATNENGNSLPSWLTFDAVTGSFNGIPGNADVGSLNLKVTATDTNGTVVADTFTLSVANVNDAPTLEKAIANQTATQNTTFSFTFAEDTFKDVDVDDSLSYSATLENGSSLPNWLTFDTATRTFTGTPSNADVGNIRVKLVALDKTGATATATLGLEVIKLNNTPVATDDAAITLENQAVTISATKLLVNDKDIDGDILKISNVGNAISGSVAFNQNGDVVFTPAANFTGKATFEYTVSDGNGGSDTAQVIVNVNPDNNIKGTSGRDVLTGNDADNIITGFQGQDILTGGGGNDQFVYTNIRDAGDTITDFQVGSDKIVITELLKSLGYSGSNPIADSYVKFGSSGNNAILQIDPDGNGSQRPTSLVTVQNLTVAQLSNTNNFLF